MTPPSSPQPSPQVTARKVEVLVVGAGPVGLASAIALKQAPRDIDVVVIERSAQALDKACGEGIMPAGVDALQALGIDVSAHAGRAFDGIRYIDGPYMARGSFVDRPGWAMRRTALTQVLRARAQALGIAIIAPCTWQTLSQSEHGVVLETSRGRWQAHTLVAADGLHSPIRAHLDLDESAARLPRRFGVRRHYACAPWSSDIEVYWADGAEAYVTPIGEDCIGVAMLWGPEPASFDALLARFAPLAKRLEGKAHQSRVRGAGRLAQPSRARVVGRVALVGDAAGYLDALTGEGLTMGFLSALALGRVIAARAPLHAYARDYRRLSRSYYREARWLLMLAQRPWLRRCAMRLISMAPFVMQGLITAHNARRFVRLGDFFGRGRARVPALPHLQAPKPSR